MATIRLGAPFLVSGTVLAAALLFAPRPDLEGVRPIPLAASTVLVGLVAVVVCALRWRLFLPAGWSVARAVRRYGEALFAGLFLPFGSDLYRAFGSRAEARATVLDRVVAGLVTVLAAAAAVPFAGDLWPMPFLAPSAAAGFAGAIGVAVVAVLVRSRRADAGRLAAAVALTVLYVAGLAVSVWLTSVAVGAELPLASAALVAPAILLGAALPSVFGVSPGVGAVVWLLPRGGFVEPAEAVAVAALLLVELWITGCVGGVFLALRKVGR